MNVKRIVFIMRLISRCVRPRDALRDERSRAGVKGGGGEIVRSVLANLGVAGDRLGNFAAARRCEIRELVYDDLRPKGATTPSR